MEAICTHGMPSPAACTDCMYEGTFVCGRRTEPRPERVHDMPSFEAKFPGHCSACNTAIHEGELIVRMVDGTYEHAQHHPHSHPSDRWSVRGA